MGSQRPSVDGVAHGAEAGGAQRVIPPPGDPPGRERDGPVAAALGAELASRSELHRPPPTRRRRQPESLTRDRLRGRPLPTEPEAVQPFSRYRDQHA